MKVGNQPNRVVAAIRTDHPEGPSVIMVTIRSYMLFTGFDSVEGARCHSLHEHLPAVRHNSFLIVRNRDHLDDAFFKVNTSDCCGTNLNRFFMSHEVPPVSASAATKSSSDG